MANTIAFVLGMILGGIIIAIIRRRNRVGTLLITHADESQPYMSLALDKDVSYIRSKKHVSMKIHENYMAYYEEQ